MFALKEVQNKLLEINPRFDLDQFGLKKPSGGLINLPEPVQEVKYDNEGLRSIVTNTTRSFDEEQQRVFNYIIEEILPRASVDDPYAPIIRQPEFTSRKCRGFSLDAPGATGKAFTIRAIQTLLKLRTRTTIAVATSAVAVSLLDEGRTAHSAFKIPIPCYSDSIYHITL